MRHDSAPRPVRGDRRCCRHCHSLTRRRFVTGVAAGGATALAGCLGGDDVEERDPVAFPDAAQCQVCGMIVAGSYGPNGQQFFDGDYPPDSDGPAWYDSVRELCSDRFTREDRYEPIGAYVTDFSSVEFAIETVDDTEFITGSVDLDALVRLQDAVYVIESGIEGVMGPEMHPFSDADDADAFVGEYGGEVIPWDDVTPQVVNAL